MNSEDQGNFNAITRKALENYVLELVRGYSKEHERMFHETHGRDRNVFIREAQLEGEYPEAVIRIRVDEPQRNFERWQTHLLWQDPTFFDEDGKRLCSPERMAGDILMHARGG